MTAPAGSGSAPEVAARLLEELVRRGETVAVAESLTGGLVAGRLTAVPGASRAFRGAVTAYATDVKRDVLGVDGGLLDERGAVDAEVARRMAEGVRRVLCADWGVATTGVAGPDPQDGKPVGLVYVAVAGPGHPRAPEPPGAGTRVRARECRLDGDRADVREGAVLAALELLREETGGP
ncbi:CinA family protein [Streptomyces sp. DSM 42041]|uniref:CinA family protein n=1 Tax=Streptomyces hazeniae TaxID=3075538 RepID=A0ABU2NZT7_9ACTN|nr:CinA family protein [Streptomyces sp. DSM 42041]MDT0382249.1 CinA family protein [Streptomyces sp. DSM 42041]